MQTRGFGAWVILALSACGAVEAPPQQPVATGAPVSAAKSPAPPPRTEPPVPGRPNLIPLPPSPSAAAKIAIRSPQRDFVAEPARVGELVADVDAAEWLAGDERRRVALVLDDYRVRYVTRSTKPYRVTDLVTAGTELARGEHRLTAIAVSAEGALIRPTRGNPPPFASVRFWVGERGTPPRATGSAARWIYVEPQGTFNGTAAAALARLDYYVIGPDGAPVDRADPVDVIIRWPGGTLEQRLSEWRPWALSNLISGDYEVELRPAGSGDVPASSARHVFSVNLDAPVNDAQHASISTGPPGSTR